MTNWMKRGDVPILELVRRSALIPPTLEEDPMKLTLIGAIALCAACVSLPASAMPIAPRATSSASNDVVPVRHGGHGHHYGWHHGRGHHYGWYRGHHHGW
jgi:hypothetical protein